MHDLEDIVQRAREADPVVVRALREGARRLGRVLASIVATVNPAMLVLGGSLGRLEIVATEIERQVRGDTVDRAMQKLRVVPSQNGDDSGTVGLSRQLVRTVFSAAAVDALLVDAAKPEPAGHLGAIPGSNASAIGGAQRERAATTRAPTRAR